MNTRKIETTILTDIRRRRSTIVPAETRYTVALKKVEDRQVLESLPKANASKNVQLRTDYRISSLWNVQSGQVSLIQPLLYKEFPYGAGLLLSEFHLK